MNGNFAADLHRRATIAMQAGHADADEHGGQIQASQYMSETLTSQELSLLRQHPQPVATSSSLASPGSWLSMTHFGVPLLLVRQENGRAQAFVNVCRHRGARVVPEGSGSEARTFVCPYHAWSYGPDGALRGVPESFGFPCLKREESGLRKLATVERAGLVWVVLDPSLSESDPGLRLGALMDSLEALEGLSMPVGFAPRSYIVEANWKLLIDGTFEAYHFKVAHRKTIAHMFAGNMQIVDEFDLHRRLYLIKAKFSEDKPEIMDFDPRKYGNISYFFFPTTMILVQPDHAQLSSLEPISATRTRVHEITLLPQLPTSDKATRYWEANVDLYRRTLAEDYELAESIQAGLATGANEALTFGTFEYSALRFHSQLQQQLAAMRTAR